MHRKIATFILFLFIGTLDSFAQTPFKDWNWQQDSSGLKYVILKSGNEVHPDSNSYVRVRYVTILDENSKVDTAAVRKIDKTDDLFLDDMIRGFSLAVTMLGEGGEGFFCVPPKLAYEHKVGDQFQNETFIFFIALDRKLSTDQLYLSYQPFNKLIFDTSTVKETKKKIGEPNTIRYGSVFANFGSWCIHTYYSKLYYDSLDCILQYYSTKRHKQGNRKLSMITINKGSVIRINDSLQMNQSDTNAVKRMYGSPGGWFAADKDKHEIYWYYKLRYSDQKVMAQFIFGDTGILQRIEITEGY